MKTKKVIVGWYLRIVLACVSGNICPQMIWSSDIKYSSEERVEVYGNDKWRNEGRSLTSTTPTAYINNNILSIQNVALNRDLTIHIIDGNGQIVYQQEITKADATSLIIMLDAFPEGEYMLELSNSSGGYLYGYFTIY